MNAERLNHLIPWLAIALVVSIAITTSLFIPFAGALWSESLTIEGVLSFLVPEPPGGTSLSASKSALAEWIPTANGYDLRVSGEVCVSNEGEIPTENLSIVDAIQVHRQGETYTDTVSTSVDVSGMPILEAGASFCYPYQVIFTPEETRPKRAHYRNVARVTITNHSGWMPGDHNCPGTELCPFGPEPKADIDLPRTIREFASTSVPIATPTPEPSATPNPAPTATPSPTPPPKNTCTHSAEYWGSHPDEWPRRKLEMGGRSYKRGELMGILAANYNGDVTILLGQELIAARFNALSGVDGSVVQGVLRQADEYLAEHPIGSNPQPPERDMGWVLSNQLADYNHGAIGPGACAGETRSSVPSATPAPTETALPTPTLAQDTPTLSPPEEASPTPTLTQTLTSTLTATPTETPTPSETSPPTPSLAP